MFIVVMRDIADVEPFEHQPGAAGLARGSAAVLTAGSLSKCGATAKPSHIIMGPADSNGLYPCIRVQPTTVFETTSTAADPEHRCSERDCHHIGRRVHRRLYREQGQRRCPWPLPVRRIYG